MTHTTTKRRWIAPTAIGVGALLAGTAIGASFTPEPEVITETVEAEPEIITEEVQVEVEVETVPSACLDGLEYADELTRIYSDALILGADGMEAAFFMDEPEIERVTQDLDALRIDQLEPALAGFFLNKELCEEAAE